MVDEQIVEVQKRVTEDKQSPTTQYNIPTDLPVQQHSYRVFDQIPFNEWSM